VTADCEVLLVLLGRTRLQGLLTTCGAGPPPRIRPVANLLASSRAIREDFETDALDAEGNVAATMVKLS
jgi:hypothetical protein